MSNNSDRRSTSNANDRGGTEDRRRRREWLVETYRANKDVGYTDFDGLRVGVVVPLGEGYPACRCYRCGDLLTASDVSPDRIVPGCEGGTYRRNNIRPSCLLCQRETGSALGHARKAIERANDS